MRPLHCRSMSRMSLNVKLNKAAGALSSSSAGGHRKQKHYAAGNPVADTKAKTFPRVLLILKQQMGLVTVIKKKSAAEE